MSAPVDAILIDPADDVVCVLRDVAPGEVLRLAGGKTVTAIDRVPLGHKVARTDCAKGALVRKYGAPIGTATAAIGKGAHVHLHNLTGLAREGEGVDGSHL